MAGRGAAHVGSPRGPPLGSVCGAGSPRASGDPETHREVASPPTQPGPPRASSPGLRAAASRALRPRLGLARLGSVRFGSQREEPPGLRLARGGASGSVLIGWPRDPAWNARARRGLGRAPRGPRRLK